ncbi:MAG: right-handed parallel beta-helix repeat-containing protein [Candidatus Lokiarchaeota archaeon]|nr:right-handed parallel beta-helix repeat-containing protein [Candidatus Lokiarchaeota archaeon]
MISISIPILAVTAKKKKLESGPIIIDEYSISGPTWADLADEPWLKGSGTEDDPYMIKNLEIDAGGNFFCMMIMNSEAYFKIMDCTFSNTGPYYSPDGSGKNAALILVNTQNGVIFKNEMFDCGFPETELGGGIALVASSNNKVQKNYCHDNELSGIYVQYSNDNIIRQNLCTGNTWGIFISEWSNNNEVTKNKCYDNEEHGILLWSEANGNLITENECYGHFLGGITVSGSHGNIITGNDCSENFGSGISVESSYGNLITDNYCSENAEAGINLEYSNDNIITRNLCTGNLWGISMGYGSNSNEVTENDCSNNLEYGIFLLGNADYNLITDNNCMENLVAGIVLSGTNGNIITDNYCSEHDGAGIVIVGWYGSAEDNILCGNMLENNYYGVYFSYVSNNDVFRNTIKHNAYGIFLEGYCVRNHIYHNNIIENDVQASDEDATRNDWHNIYMLEGNYWSNYEGADSNGDGIGDTPWPEIGYDAHPFKEQDGWDIITAEEEEWINAFFAPDTNRLRGMATVRDDEVCYIIIGFKYSFSERTERLFFPPYTANYQFDGVLYSFQGRFWYYDEAMLGLPGYVEFFVKKVPANYFRDDLNLDPGVNYFQWVLSWYDDGVHIEIEAYRWFDLVL